MKPYKILVLTITFILSLLSNLYAQNFFDQTLIAPGLNYSLTKTDTPPLAIHAVELDLSSPFIQLETVLANDSLMQRDTLSSIARRSGSTLAINGDFFDPATGMIVNFMVSNGELIKLPISRGVFAITRDGQPIISMFTLNINIETQYGIIPINSLNTPRGANEAALFTARFGKNTSVSTNALAGIDIELLDFSQALPCSGVITAKVGNMYYGVTSSPIPKSGGILSLGGRALSYLPYLKQGDVIRIVTKLTPSLNISQAIGGGAILLKDGNIVFNATGELPLPKEVTDKKNPLTAVGIDNNGKVYFVVVDGRNPKSEGMTYIELANYLKNIGMKDALTLDGGGSSQLIINGRIINNPSDGRERPIPNAIVVKTVIPKGEPRILSLHPRKLTIKEGETYNFTLLLQDIYGNIFPIDQEKVFWRLEGLSGFISKDGVFYAQSSSNGKIVATLNGLRAEAEVIIVPSQKISKILEDFESNILLSISGSGFDLNLTKVSISDSQSISGKRSLKLDYSLSKTGPSFIYINLNIPLPKESKKISICVYGDNSGHWLRGLFRDSNGRLWVGNFTSANKGIDWEGWRYIELDLSNLEIFAGDKNAKPEYPLELLQLYLVQLKEEKKNQGVIYIDLIQSL
ncbi:MAG: phosphodiester glycosidase family protein [bacterium]|nr:phosphodiester glycosidase family protein [bacterium]